MVALRHVVAARRAEMQKNPLSARGLRVLWRFAGMGATVPETLAWCDFNRWYSKHRQLFYSFKSSCPDAIENAAANAMPTGV